MHDRPLVVPYSIQETLPKPESVKLQCEKTLLRVQVSPPSASSSELTPNEDPVSCIEEDSAHSYVEEINLEDDQSIETKNKSLFRRFVFLLLYQSLYNSIKDKIREFDKRTKHFPLGDQFIDSHNLFSLLWLDIVRRRLMLGTLATKRVLRML